MIVKSSLIVALLLIANANAFNNSLEYYKDTAVANNRSGKFLFDTLFGLELEEELINAASSSPNTLKSCDCGKSRPEMRGNENESEPKLSIFLSMNE